ncbi:MAG: hypothetical protein SOY37_09230 [Oscillospiraceae bacterium]|nr:hypothetical protein [Oscillospiraceae bacterium]
MASYEFGVMDPGPLPGVRYDAYEPEKYRCIPVRDDLIDPLLEAFSAFDTCYHTLSVPGTGLSWAGITLIPPDSLPGFLSVLPDGAAYDGLRAVLRDARARNRFVICYGL